MKSNPHAKAFSATLLILFMALASGCASTGSIDNDPLENLNRKVTSFNLATDKAILAPAARGYVKVIPRPVRNGVSNFFSNLFEPYTIVNDLLQGQFRLAGQDTGRFVINTTLGFLGLNDVASHMDLPKRREDFGQTLAVWGMPSGPHLVLPFFGPSNLRDAVDLVPRFAYSNAVGPNAPSADIAATAVRIVDLRSQFLGLDEILDVQADKYLFLREGYRQRRFDQIHNGSGESNGPTDDELLEELLEDN